MNQKQAQSLHPSEPYVTLLLLNPPSISAAQAQIAMLQQQSMPFWELLILSTQTDQLGTDDQRVRWTQSPLRDLLPSLRAYVCVLDYKVKLATTFLEKTLWLLSTNPNIAACDSERLQPAPLSGVRPGGFAQGTTILQAPCVRAPFVLRCSILQQLYSAIGHGTGEHVWWQLWLAMAKQGMWGYTIPEALIFEEETDAPLELPLEPAFLNHYQQSLTGRFPAMPGPEDLRPYEHIETDILIQAYRPKPDAIKRLLIIMPWLIVGGAERVNLDLVRYLTDHGYEVSFVTTMVGAEHGWWGEFGKYSNDIFVLHRFLRLADTPRFLVSLIQSREIDTVMISNSYLGYQLLPYLRAYCPHVTYVDYCHSLNEQWNNGGYPRCGAAYQQVLDLNITSSEYVRQWMHQRGAALDRIQISYTNVDVDHWYADPAERASVRSQLGIRNDQTLIAFLGRISSEKRPELLADILNQLHKTHPDAFRAIIIGDGPLRELLVQRTQALQQTQVVHILGRLEDAAIRTHLAAADVLLLPSEVEGISVAVFEAMACATIPVSVKVGGQAELVSPDVGFLIPLGSQQCEQYVAALQKLIDDPALRIRMATAARERVATKFPLADFGPRMQALFNQAAELHDTQPRLPISPGYAREHIVQALELARMEAAFHYLWTERVQWQKAQAGPLAHIPQAPIVKRGRAFAGRVYRWSARRLPALGSMREKIRTWSQGRL